MFASWMSTCAGSLENVVVLALVGFAALMRYLRTRVVPDNLVALSIARCTQTTYLRSRSCRSTPTSLGCHKHVGAVGVRQHHEHRRHPYRDRSGKRHNQLAEGASIKGRKFRA